MGSAEKAKDMKRESNQVGSETDSPDQLDLVDVADSAFDEDLDLSDDKMALLLAMGLC